MICSMGKAAFEIKDSIFRISCLRKAVFHVCGQDIVWPILCNLSKRRQNRRDWLLVVNAFEQPGIKRIKLAGLGKG